MAEIDKKYKKTLIESEIRELPYQSIALLEEFSFTKNVILLFLLGASVIPFLPPRYRSWTEWTFPSSFQDYFSRAKNVLVLCLLVTAVIIIPSILFNLRTFIDRLLGYKKVGVFKVISIYKFGSSKIIFLNNWHFFTLTKEDYLYNEVQTGQLILVERSVTNRLLNCKIHT